MARFLTLLNSVTASPLLGAMWSQVAPTAWTKPFASHSQRSGHQRHVLCAPWLARQCCFGCPYPCCGAGFQCRLYLPAALWQPWGWLFAGIANRPRVQPPRLGGWCNPAHAFGLAAFHIGWRFWVVVSPWVRFTFLASCTIKTLDKPHYIVLYYNPERSPTDRHKKPRASTRGNAITLD
jgi:hypothetical protein